MATQEQQPEFDPPSKEWTLLPQSEYRFELDPGAMLAVHLASGRAEVFGAELALGRTYIFSHECRAAVFTWHGCTIEVTGSPSTEYVSDETTMVPYSNLHIALEQMRIRAKNGSPNPEDPTGRTISEPPRIMVIGPENSGKTSACKIMANYSVRTGRLCTPTFVNLDPGEGGWVVPGTVSACVLSLPMPTSSPASPFGSTSTSAPTALSSSSLLPIVYWYGHNDIKRNAPLMEKMIQNLAQTIKERTDNDPITRNSGIIIDTPSSFATAVRAGNEMRYPLVQTCIEEFGVNIIVVIGHEKLNVEMQRLFSNSSNSPRRITVVKVPKSGGVVELDHAYRTRIIANQIRTYFYGPGSLNLPSSIQQSTLGGEAQSTADMTLSPYSSILKFTDIKIYRIGAESMAPTSALPIGASRVVSEMVPTRVEPSSPGVLNSILALLPPPPQSPGSDEEAVPEEFLLSTDVIGFLLVTAIDTVKHRITVLSPNPGSLVGRVALIGSSEWQDL